MQALGVVACGEVIVVFLGGLPLVESSGHGVEVVLDAGELFLSDVEVSFFWVAICGAFRWCVRWWVVAKGLGGRRSRRAL